MIELRVRETLYQPVLDSPQESVAGFAQTTRLVVEYCLRCVAYGGVLAEGLPEQALDRIRLAALRGVPAAVMVERYRISAEILWGVVVEEITDGDFSPQVRFALSADAAELGPTLLGSIDRQIVAAHESALGSAPRRTIAVKLTRRQHEIHSLLRAGCTDKAIAQALTIEVETVYSHIKNMRKKAGVSSRHQLAELEFLTDPGDG
jgi:DNA-binding NarL/FixJ family response regulator